MDDHVLRRRLVLLAVLVPLIEATLLLNWDATLLFLLDRVTDSFISLAVLVMGIAGIVALAGVYLIRGARLDTEAGALRVAGYWVVSQGFCWWVVHTAILHRNTPSVHYPSGEFSFLFLSEVIHPDRLLAIAFFALFLLISGTFCYFAFRNVGEGWRLGLWTPSGKVRWRWIASWLFISLGLFAVWVPGLLGTSAETAQSFRTDALLWMPPILRETVDILFWKPFLFLTKIFSMALFPVGVSVGWLFTLMALRVNVESEGIVVRLAGFGICLARALWEKVWRIDVVRHKGIPPSLVLHYWTRWRIPFSLNLSAQRYLTGEKLTEAVENEAKRRKIRMIYRYSPDGIPRLAYLFLALAIGLNLSQFILSSELWMRFIYDVIPSTRLNEIYAGIPLASLFVGSTLCFGIYLGLLSAFYRGGFRPVLAGLWVVASRWVPDPHTHWLVWNAIYAIHKAILWIVVPSPEIPVVPMWEIHLAHTLVALGPAFAGLGYVLGVVSGCWRKPALVSAVQHASSQKPAPVSS